MAEEVIPVWPEDLIPGDVVVKRPHGKERVMVRRTYPDLPTTPGQIGRATVYHQGKDNLNCLIIVVRAANGKIQYIAEHPDYPWWVTPAEHISNFRNQSIRADGFIPGVAVNQLSNGLTDNKDFDL